MNAYEELVESVRSIKPYSTGSIHEAGQKSQWTVCDASGHIMFFHKREAAETACERMNTQAVLAEVLRTLETVTPEMEKADWWSEIKGPIGRDAYLAMLRASPLKPDKESK